MQMVSTLINGKQWRVPIPRATTLEHIRIELLNLGAEYVWLDVLCLRQRDRLEDEARRIEEWKIDVPTIGYIYQGSPYGRPCITYFNGLGLALDTCPAALASPQHWFNRVWTLQESLSSWLPGGLSGTPQPGDAALFAGFGSLARLTRDALVPEMMRRLCTNELDRIAGLAYCLRCTTLPLYSEAVAVEDAWQLLLKHISHVWRMDVFLRYTVDVPFAIHPSWKGLVEARPALRDSLVSSLKGNLWLVDKSQLHSAHLWQYYHDAKSFPLCKIVCHNYAAGIARASPRIELEFCFDAEEANVPRLRLSPLELQGILVQGATYKTLRLPIHQEVIWVLVEPLNGAQWWTNTLEVLKWAVVRFSPKDSVRLSEVYRGRGQDAAGRPRATPM
ncbi:hypothetical protein PsYK624_053110 [Phanerochaete sordida]|uniref:Heterokaryon incompatibility domain-containing protein n=1 Tax=Phanerochaete sordida TaxID=48140 RepID=A0A9P3LB85_9APHY|nr:hypothetical protein PsYK624_053110 [Phanerochaete sordida]